MRKFRVPDYRDRRVFGVPLTVTARRSGHPLPPPIIQAMDYLRKNALDQVGVGGGVTDAAPRRPGAARVQGWGLVGEWIWIGGRLSGERRERGRARGRRACGTALIQRRRVLLGMLRVGTNVARWVSAYF